MSGTQVRKYVRSSSSSASISARSTRLSDSARSSAAVSCAMSPLAKMVATPSSVDRRRDTNAFGEFQQDPQRRLGTLPSRRARVRRFTRRDHVGSAGDTEACACSRRRDPRAPARHPAAALPDAEVRNRLITTREETHPSKSRRPARGGSLCPRGVGNLGAQAIPAGRPSVATTCSTTVLTASSTPLDERDPNSQPVLGGSFSRLLTSRAPPIRSHCDCCRACFGCNTYCTALVHNSGQCH